MNPKFTEVILNSFIIIMNIFYTNPARKFGITERKFGMIDITHGVDLCILHFGFVNKI